MLFVALVPALLCTAVLVAYALRTARSGRAIYPRLGPSPGSVFLPSRVVEAFYWALHGPARLIAHVGLDPDSLTYASLVVSAMSVPLLATGHFVIGAIAIVIGAGLDVFDGIVARAQGRASPAGAVLDSFVDRLADAAPYMGLALFYRARIETLAIPLTAIVASSLVSYARAKAEIYRLVLPNGVMRRHERVVYLLGSLLLAPVAPRLDLVPDIAFPLTLVGVALIAAASALAACVLVARTRAALADRHGLERAVRRETGAAPP